MGLRVCSGNGQGLQNVVLILNLLVFAGGCGPATVRDKVLRKNSTDPFEIASNMLEGYVQGQPVGSEAEGYQEMIASVTTVDAVKGGELKKFLDSIEQTGHVDRKEAKRLFEMFRSEGAGGRINTVADEESQQRLSAPSGRIDFDG